MKRSKEAGEKKLEKNLLVNFRFFFSSFLFLILVMNVRFVYAASLNPLRVDTFYAFIALIINDIVIPIGTTIAILAVIYSGFLFVTAQGNPERLTRARSAFTWAVIGGLILIGAWAIALAIEATMAGITTP